MPLPVSTGAPSDSFLFSEEKPPQPTEQNDFTKVAISIISAANASAEETNSRLTKKIALQNPPLLPGLTKYYVNGKISNIITTADVVCLVGTKVFYSITFVDAQGKPKNGGIIIVDGNSELAQPNNNNAKKIFHTQNILDSESDLSLMED